MERGVQFAGFGLGAEGGGVVELVADGRDTDRWHGVVRPTRVPPPVGPGWWGCNGVEFETDNEYLDNNSFHIRSRKLLGEPTTPGMVKFLMKTGIAKTEKQATIILVVFILLIVSFSIYLVKAGPREDIIITTDGRIIPVEIYITSLENGVDLLDRKYAE